MGEEDINQNLVACLQTHQVLTLRQGGHLQRVEAVHHGSDGSVIETSRAPSPPGMVPSQPVSTQPFWAAAYVDSWAHQEP